MSSKYTSRQAANNIKETDKYVCGHMRPRLTLMGPGSTLLPGFVRPTRGISVAHITWPTEGKGKWGTHLGKGIRMLRNTD